MFTVGLQDFPQQSYYGVFDGHAGMEAAVYASNHLHVHLPACEKFSSDPEAALKCSYKATDDNFIKKAQREVLVFWFYESKKCVFEC